MIDALNRTRVAADDYQSLSLRQLDLQVSLAVMFAVVALLLVLASIWVGLNLATSIAGPLVRVMTVAEQVRSGNFKERVPESDDVDEVSRLGPVSTGCLMMYLAAASNLCRQIVSWMQDVNSLRLY